MKPVVFKLPTKLYRPTILGQQPNLSRRQFVLGSSALAVSVGMSLPLFSPLLQAAQEGRASHGAANPLLANSLGFNGERKDPLTGLYHLGKGYRAYNPVLMRFHACDNMSPFGKGGINSYAYCLGDPINLKDPSGHFALMSLLMGAIVGAAVGAAISATAEGIRAGVTNTGFDWKQVGIGAALGAISGGFGAAAQGMKTGIQAGLAVADSIVSGAVDFGLNMAAGSSTKDAGINAGIGAVIGLATFGISLSYTSKAATYRSRSLYGRDKVNTEILYSREYKRRRLYGEHWHQVNIDNRRILWGADTVTSHDDVAWNPIQQIARRNSRSDVHIYTGGHGMADGDNWMSQLRWPDLDEFDFYMEDTVFKSRSSSHMPRRRVYLHDMAGINKHEFTAHLSRQGHHIQAYCFSRNDSYLLKYFNLEPVTSFTRL
ncbi:RHS repeat-associated core domain-containing protein [Vibrio anguillarum]|uniref:RHS repeat-associated core domain-containing protein n=1 Tax=Vibrio anguillarum TaxID=55601 RepID=UPI00030F90D2|nr:RHS repeat-associated core domain-containing protein [Vibrio anguillarum]OEE35448.1 hypothetical protein A1QW_07805 [Vibrio anguillarum]OEF92166.1 hypothetical protein A1QY_15420 [Vibrio anguillarum]